MPAAFEQRLAALLTIPADDFADRLAAELEDRKAVPGANATAIFSRDDATGFALAVDVVDDLTGTPILTITPHRDPVSGLMASAAIHWQGPA